jgi:hypothetical protein
MGNNCLEKIRLAKEYDLATAFFLRRSRSFIAGWGRRPRKNMRALIGPRMRLVLNPNNPDSLSNNMLLRTTAEQSSIEPSRRGREAGASFRTAVARSRSMRKKCLHGTRQMTIKSERGILSRVG